MKRLLSHIVLPGEVTEFEAAYLARLNRIGFVFFALHLPVFAAIAYFNQTGVALALVLSSFALAGPALALRTFENPRNVSLVYGFTAMIMGGILVHVGQGPVQIEMHFYFFALIAMLAVFGNPMAVVVAAVTVALHHLLGWWLVPSSLFNYDAEVWVVAIHAAFVVLESVATCFIARMFFDNIIGLDRIVQARTRQLDARNQDMRLVLDNAGQGFLSIDRHMVLSDERSRIIDEWLGTPEPGMRLCELLARETPKFADMFEMTFSAIEDGFLPLDLCLDQLPKEFRARGRHLRLELKPVMSGEIMDKAVVVISDVSAEVERKRIEMEQRDVMSVLSRFSSDKAGVLEFFEEARGAIEALGSGSLSATDERRLIHTLKGNAMLFGISSVGEYCHALESTLLERDAPATREELAHLNGLWRALCKAVDTLLGEQTKRKIEIDDAEYEAILKAVVRGEPHEKIAAMIQACKLEPTRQRLARVAEQAKTVAKRLNKGSIQIGIEDHQLKLDPEQWAPFWASFVHVVRNAVDHGLEEPSERMLTGKAEKGTLVFTTRMDGDELVIELRDDGRGIDWERVAEKARQLGIPSETEQDLVEALFADGVSTRDEVSHYSGRGVGMSAVRSAANERGGRISVNSPAGGGGTRVEFRFPATAKQPGDGGRMAG